MDRSRFLWPLLLAATIFLASSRSTVATPDLGFANVDKVVHFSVYGLLATLTVRLGHNARAAWCALLAVSLFGVTDEWHQSFVPGRSSSAADWVADTTGAALAIALYTRWVWYRVRLEGRILGKAQIENPRPIATDSAP